MKWPSTRKKHDRDYREKHKTEIEEYNRLNPELRIRLPLEDHYLLGNLFGRDLREGIRNLIRREALIRFRKEE
jgi:hypothetical protein